MESSILKVFVCVCVFFCLFSFFQCKLIFPSRYSLLYIPHSVMSTFSHTVYINSMKQKGLPLVSNKAAPCTVLSHSLVDSAPHVHQTNAQIHTDRHGHLIQQSPSHMAQVTSCYCVTFPFLHPFLFPLHDEPTRKFIHLSPRVQAFCSFIK